MNIVYIFVLCIAGAIFSVFLHELGHYVCARLLGVRPTSIRFGGGRKFASFSVNNLQILLHMNPFGGSVGMVGEERNGWVYFAIVLAGPLTHAALCGICLFVAGLTTSNLVYRTASILAVCNVLMFCFNLWPTGGDGKFIAMCLFGEECVERWVHEHENHLYIASECLKVLTFIGILYALFHPTS